MERLCRLSPCRQPARGGEFDLVIVTHCNVLIIELKHWNGNKISVKGDKWFLGNKEQGRSPVTVTRHKKFLLERKLDKYKQQFSSKNRPNVDFLVVMSGNADFSQLPENEKPHVISLSDFLALKNEQQFNARFRPHPKNKTLNQDFAVFDQKIFAQDQVKARTVSIAGYVAQSEFEQPDFKHPQDIYREYFAISQQTQHDNALLRRWNFNNIDYPEAKTPQGRYCLVSHEYQVLQHIKLHNQSLYHHCLTYKNVPQQEEITAEHIDIFELYPNQKRFAQFVGGEAIKYLSPQRRLTLVKQLLEKLAQLHHLGIAHQDLGQHSIWLSPDDNITVSGFNTAYLATKPKTNDIWQILPVNRDFAAEVFAIPTTLTPYQHDVRALAILAWHILVGKRISAHSLRQMQTELNDNNDNNDNTAWYLAVFRQALSDKPFTDADAFLEAFRRAIPDEKLDFSFDMTRLTPYYHVINHARKYRETGSLLIDTSEKEVYRSNILHITAWLEQDPKQNRQAGQQVFKWLQRIEKLSALAPPYLPRIKDFGIATKTSSLFIARLFIYGYKWYELVNANLTDERKLRLIKALINSVEHLHQSGLVHGNLTPDCVKVLLGNDDQVYLLDLYEFPANGQQQFSLGYAPPFKAGAKQRDNFAVMKMASELLGLTWYQTTKNEKFAPIAAIIQQEYRDDPTTAFFSLARFKQAIEQKNIPVIAIQVGSNTFADLTIYPENGELFLQFKRSKKYPNEEIDITFIGLGGKLTAFYTLENKSFRHALAPIERDYVARADKDDSVLSLPIKLSISANTRSNLKALSQYLAKNPFFKQAIDDFSASFAEKAKQPTAAKPTTDAVTAKKEQEQQITAAALWQAILATETEALPALTANDTLQTEKSDNSDNAATEHDKQFIPYYGDIDPTEQFRKDETVEAIGRLDNDKIVKYGIIDISRSRTQTLYLKKVFSAAEREIADGTPIYLQSLQNKASYQRRKSALQRILERRSVIPHLIDYFDPGCQRKAIDYRIEVSEKQFNRYNRLNEHGQKISLNPAQRQAFNRLLRYGPLSLLQGPPGTGKTEFIAAFVHYLFEQRHAKKILLVSQSHEAVNTAAERIRKHCQRLGSPLEMVRFSNRDIPDSSILADIFSSNLVAQKHQQLDVDKIANIRKMGRTLGLPEDYLGERAKLTFQLGTQIRRYQKIADNEKSVDQEEQRFRNTLENNIRQQAKQLAVEANLAIDQIMPALIQQLDSKHHIQPAESDKAGKLIELTRDMLEALSNDHCNYDEFLARSRQLVIGTCVGIGQRHLGIAENRYDWVIIDEAARSISSELAVAMQSGTRILLVGDHQQLPPLYSTEHKNALARHLAISKRGEELDQLLGSDFARVFTSYYGEQVCASLKTQYRMAPAIGTLISTCFYDGLLQNGKSNDDIPHIYHGLPYMNQANVCWLDTGKLANAYHQEKNKSCYNHAEAKTIIALLHDLAADDTFMSSQIVQQCLHGNNQAIGVICMYAEQKRLIRQLFNQQTWEDNFKKIVKIDTVDSYQGKENRIIILSLTRHDKKYSTGFLYLPNRINVALSRAMDKLIIVGAAAVWQQPQNKQKPLGKVLDFIQKHCDTGEYQLTLLREKGTKK